MAKEVVVVGAGVGLGRPFYQLGAAEWLRKEGVGVSELDVLALDETNRNMARALAVGYMTLSRWPRLYDLTRTIMDRRPPELTDREKLTERLKGRQVLSVSPVASGELAAAGVSHCFVAGDFWVHESTRGSMIESIFVPKRGLVERGEVIGGAALPIVFSERRNNLSLKIQQLTSGRVPDVGFLVNGAGGDMVSWLGGAARMIREEKIRATFFVGTNTRLFWGLKREANRLGIGKIDVKWADTLPEVVRLKTETMVGADVVVTPTANECTLARPIIFMGARNAAERANAEVATAMGWGRRVRSSGEMAEVLRLLTDNGGYGLRGMLRNLDNELLMDAGAKMTKSIAGKRINRAE